MFHPVGRGRIGDFTRGVSGIALVVVLILGHAGSSRGAEPAWLAEARSGWRYLADRPLPTRWAGERQSSSGGEVTLYRRYLFYHEPGRFVGFTVRSRQETATIDSLIDHATMATGFNGRYHFIVARPGSDSTTWAINRLMPLAVAEKDEKSYYRAMMNIIRRTPIGVGPQNALLHEITDTDYYSIETSERVTRGDRSLLKVVLRWEGPEDFVFPSHSTLPNNRYTLFLDPSKHWYIAESEHVDADGDTIRKFREISDEAGLLVVEKTTIVGASGKLVASGFIRYDHIDFEFDPPDKYFELAGFGIAEPVELGEPNRWWWLAALVGAALIALGLLLIRRMQ